MLLGFGPSVQLPKLMNCHELGEVPEVEIHLNLWIALRLLLVVCHAWVLQDQLLPLPFFLPRFFFGAAGFDILDRS